jgi:hypothetical protein
MLITPLEFVAFMLLITAAAGIARVGFRRRHVGKLRALASERKMHYSAGDRFRLGPRIGPKLGVPGAAAIRVADLLYGIEQQNYRYIFAAEYTTGVLRTKTGIRRVATFCEPRTGEVPGGANSFELIFAPESLPIVEQYRHLLSEEARSQK